MFSSAKEQNEIGYDDYIAIFIKVIDKLIDVQIKFLPLMYSSDSPLAVAYVIIMVLFIPILFLYIAAVEVITHVPNTRYRHVIVPIIYVSGVLTCVVLLLILFLSQTPKIGGK